jgi:hypothetical protein
MERVGKGINDRSAARRIVICFDDETFETIRQRAIGAETSFAEQVRLLVEWGLETENRT